LWTNCDIIHRNLLSSSTSDDFAPEREGGCPALLVLVALQSTHRFAKPGNLLGTIANNYCLF
jgi:hypothetical protein